MNEECVTVFVSCIFILYTWMYLLSSITVVPASIYIYSLYYYTSLVICPCIYLTCLHSPCMYSLNPPTLAKPSLWSPSRLLTTGQDKQIASTREIYCSRPRWPGKLFPRKLTHTQQPSSGCMVSKSFCIPPPTALFSPLPLPLPPQRARLGLR